MEKSIYSNNYIYLIYRLNSERKRLKISQITLATNLGKPQSFISKIETRERKLDIIEFIEISLAMGINPKGIFNDLVDKYIKEKGGN